MGQPVSSPEPAAHAFLLLDRVTVRAWRSPTAEIDIVSSMDHHYHGHVVADRAIGESYRKEESMAEIKVRSALCAPHACSQLPACM